MPATHDRATLLPRPPDTVGPVYESSGARRSEEKEVHGEETGDQTDQESSSEGTDPQVDFFCWTE